MLQLKFLISLKSLKFRSITIARNYAGTLIVNRPFFHCGYYVLYTSQNVANYLIWLHSWKNVFWKSILKNTTQSLPTHFHNTRLWPFWKFWAIHTLKTWNLSIVLSFIFRFALNLLKCALFHSYHLHTLTF